MRLSDSIPPSHYEPHHLVLPGARTTAVQIVAISKPNAGNQLLVDVRVELLLVLYEKTPCSTSKPLKPNNTI